ncbi:hypothetical protein [Agromyces larvae]|uniref:Phage gp6-like head-tail connector protein n=1 Tax=Agromyces larvae TaxID=2929802 RepID=A0ABY4C1X9_9MICO|nr:hypothetical protein [Agromyces larvae]UOE45477.1 hypothetical protein MTO99_06890 [Agromyces larvae]
MARIVEPGVRDAAFWIDAAHGAVRRYCGWHVAPLITELLELDGTGGRRILLPSLRVVALVKVVNDGRDVTDTVRFSRRSGFLSLKSGCWSDEPGTVEVTLTHGYDLAEVPEVAALIDVLAKRASTNQGAVVQQSIGPASVRVATGGDGGAVSIPLLESEKELLAPYRLTWGA